MDVIRPDFSRMILPAKDWIKYTDAIKRHGAVPSIQLAHAGLFAEPFFNQEHGTPIGPVSFVKESGTEVKAMDEEDMKRITNDFAEAAFCAKAAGFQEVMIQCCHGWLLAQFLSPAWNTRTDEYGGSIENRAKFPLQVLQAVRERIGNDVVIEIRISGDEHQTNGWTEEDCIAFCKMTEGIVDIIQISSGDYHNSEHYCFTSTLMPHFINVPYAKKLKNAGIKTAICAVGANDDPAEMERLIAAGILDFVAIGRGTLADSDLPKKILHNKEQEVRPCIRCNDCMAGLYDGFYQCNVNPIAGQEAYLLNTPGVEEKKKVLVVGGGPGGMQAAITASDRGHQVILVDNQEKLGGTLLFTDYDAHKMDLKRYTDCLVRQTLKRNIEVRLNTTADKNLLDEEQPQAIIVAAGAKPCIPNIKGVDKAYYATTAYYQPEKLGDKIILIGGGLIGCELALHLTEFGKHITILELTDQLAQDANILHKPTLFEYMDQKKDQIESILKVNTKEILDNGIVYLDENQVEHFLAADTVLYAVGSKANSDIVEELRAWEEWESFMAVGDCTGASIVRKAIHGGYFAALDMI
ncbi:FAD-dependent oxidoreductase [Eubacteriaceae bacterium ES2]|nr:FAD-dependent oxidoreductase [Eubacteriaceae bacterium ES2]